MHINIMKDNYNRIYSVKKWTFEHLFCIFLYFIIFALPFYFSFASKNFWFEELYAKMSTRYYYTGYYAVQVNYISNDNILTQQLLVIPSSTKTQLQKLSVEIDDTQNNSTFTFKLTNFNHQIISTNIIIYYDIQVTSLNRIVSAGFAFSIPGDLQSVSAAGKLALVVQSPFNAITTIKSPTINRPAYLDQNFRSTASFESLINAHLQNSYKLQSQFYYQSTSNSTDTNLPVRRLSLNLLKDTEIVFPYYPSLLQTLKIKFSRYFGMLMLSYLIFHNLLLLLIKNQALECNQRDQIPYAAFAHSSTKIRVANHVKNQNNLRTN